MPTLSIHDAFPNLVGSTQDGPGFDLYKYLDNSWGVVFMHPGDYTPVCTTELGAAAGRAPGFAKRNVKLCGFSCNDADSHRGWLEDIAAATGNTVTFPLFCDSSREFATQIGVLDPSQKDAKGLPQTVRSVFILGPDKIIKAMITYPASTGRNFDEILRCVDSLQLTAQHSVATPADWLPGSEVIVNFPLTDAQAEDMFGKDSFKIVPLPSESDGKGQWMPDKHYLRTLPDPSGTQARGGSALSILTKVSKELSQSWSMAELRKLLIVVDNMQKAGYSDAVIVSFCRAIFIDQSEDQLKEAFSLFDLNGDGSINRAELRQLLPLMGETVPEDRLGDLFKLVDGNASEKIELSEFTELVKGLNPHGDSYTAAAYAAYTEAGSSWSSWTASLTAGASALQAGWGTNIRGLGPTELKKAGRVVMKMKEAGYSEEKANQVCKALFEQKEEDMKAAFQMYDTNGNGTMEKDEFRAALPLMGEDVPADKLEEMFQKVDENKSGVIEYAEFEAALKRMNPKEEPLPADAAAGTTDGSDRGGLGAWGTWFSIGDKADASKADDAKAGEVKAGEEKPAES